MTTTTSSADVLFDTSVVIAIAGGRLTRIDERGAMSAVTLAELEFGVAQASGAVERTVRLRATHVARRLFRTLVVDDAVAREFGPLRAALRASGRRPGFADVLIAATALAHGLPLHTADQRQAAFPGVQTHLVALEGA